MKENTIGRWEEALGRARHEGLRVRELGDLAHPTFLVDSGSCEGKVYEVTEFGWCSCEAAKHGDPVCKHRALLHEYLDDGWPVERRREPMVIHGDREVRITW